MSDLAAWLDAEKQWHAEVAAWQRANAVRAEQMRNTAIQRAEADARYQKVRDRHRELVSASTGLRRAVLERHNPTQDWWSIECAVCEVAGYDGREPVVFPCPDYKLARDWSDD